MGIKVIVGTCICDGLVSRSVNYLFMFWPRSTYNYNCINRITLEYRSRWRAIAIGEWAPEYPSVRCYMYMYMIAQPETPHFFQLFGPQKGEPKADPDIPKREALNEF